MKTRILLATAGSLGDLHPFIAVARALRALDLDPVIASAPDYRAHVENTGIRFIPMGPSHSEIEADLGMTLGSLTDQLPARPDWLYRRLVFPYLRRCFDDVRPIVADSNLVMTSTLAISARIAAELEGRPQVGAILQPMMWLSASDFPIFMPGAAISHLIRSLGPIAGSLARGAIHAGGWILGRPVSRFRRALGLRRRTRDPLFASQYGSAGSIGMYSPLLGGSPQKKLRNAVITGFCVHDGDTETPSPERTALNRFLVHGTAPLVFTLGSAAVRHAGDFYSESARAALALGERAVLIAGESPPDGMSFDPDRIHVTGYVPYSAIFPKARAIIHQGGIGTFGQALRAGRPQLVVPHFADQADNAARAVRLGVAGLIARRSYRTTSVKHALEGLLTNARVQQRAKDLATELALERGADHTAAVLARIAGG